MGRRWDGTAAACGVKWRAHHAESEEQPRVTPVDELVILVLDKVGELWVARRNNAVDLSLHLGFLVVREIFVVFGQPSFPLPILQQQELNHRDPLDSRPATRSGGSVRVG